MLVVREKAVSKLKLSLILPSPLPLSRERERGTGLRGIEKSEEGEDVETSE